jgi:hypothetical protein
MTNWNSVLTYGGTNMVRDFATGQASGRRLTEEVKFTPAAGHVRQTLRTRGVRASQQAARKALRRRGLV